MSSIASVAAVLLAALSIQQGPRRAVLPIPADKPPVVTTPSGLKYCVLEKGEAGERPAIGDSVSVRYALWSADGTLLQSTREEPKPVEFAIGDVIEGWNEALQLMTPGSRFKLTIPPELAYGARGSPPLVKPGATLVFDVELVSFQKAAELPPFHRGDPEKQKRTESGLVYEPIVEGSGRAPGPDDLLEMRFAVWNTKGRLIDWSEKPRRARLRGRAAEMPLRLLQLAPQYLKVGSRYRFEAPADLCRSFHAFGAPFLPAGSITVWELELVSARELKPLPVPAFVKPDPTRQTATASGLKYEVLREGSGLQPKTGDKVSVHYTGWLEDGTMFDSSFPRGEPYSLSVPDRVIAGWNEGLLLMKEGSVFRFEIPSALAYGEQGRSPRIPGGATLVFEIEMLKVGEDPK